MGGPRKSTNILSQNNHGHSQNSNQAFPEYKSEVLLLEKLTCTLGRAIAQAVSHWLPTVAVRASSPGLVMWDFVVDKVALG
jgi:hypothetical protein